MENPTVSKTSRVRCYIRFSKPSWRKDDPEKPKNALAAKEYQTQKITDTKGFIRKFCFDKKLVNDEDDIIWYVDDGVSGGKKTYLSRKIRNLIEDCSEGDSVVFFELSRIARKMMDVSEIINKLIRANTHIYCMKPEIKLQDDMASSIYVNAFGMAAEIEREMGKIRIARAIQSKKEKGIPLGRKKGTKNINTVCAPQRDDIKQLLREGVKKTVIADKLELKYSTLCSYIKREKLKEYISKNKEE